MEYYNSINWFPKINYKLKYKCSNHFSSNTKNIFIFHYIKIKMHKNRFKILNQPFASTYTCRWPVVTRRHRRQQIECHLTSDDGQRLLQSQTFLTATRWDRLNCGTGQGTPMNSLKHRFTKLDFYWLYFLWK